MRAGLRELGRGLSGTQVLLILSGALLAVHWFGPGGAVLALAMLAPGVITARNLIDSSNLPGSALPGRDDLLRAIAAQLRETGFTSLHLVEVEAPSPELDLRLDPSGLGSSGLLLARIVELLSRAGKQRDLVARLGPARFALLPADGGFPALEAAIRKASEVQSVLAEPMWIGTVAVRLDSSVGFALSRSGMVQDAHSLLAEAEQALDEAISLGPGAIRCAGAGLRPLRVTALQLVPEVASALDQGTIRLWFQPQLSTDTGEVAGMAAVARWLHPVHGILAPAEFLAAVRASGQIRAFSDRMLDEAVSAQRYWGGIGARVPAVTLALPEESYRDPGLADRIRWDLDRAGIAPERLGLQVPLAATGEAAVQRNLGRLAASGLVLDLDDLDMTVAPPPHLRQLDLHRLRIGRELVTEVDTDPVQRQMLASVLQLAERLGLTGIATGVETAGEHTILAQMGCTLVQGMGIAPPMSLEETGPWMRAHVSRIQSPMALGRAG